MICNLCPRNCGVDRSEKRGYCGAGDKIMAARASLHYWEEPCISGEEGSGTVFFSGCSLKCVYCQNSSISVGYKGKEISVERLAEIFTELQEKKANNINLVTGDHFLPQIIKSVVKAREMGLKIPVILNTSSYLNVETVKMAKGYIDIYLADFKYMRSETGDRYSRAQDYPHVAKQAIDEMVRQTGTPIYDSRGIMQKGVIIRHMMLPGIMDESKEIIKYVHERYGNSVVMSIMNQFTPIGVDNYKEINRHITSEEYDELIDYALSVGVEEAFVQEDGTASESFIPEFDFCGI